MSDAQLAEADVEAVVECLRSGWLTLGPRTAALEEAVAERTGAPHAVAVSTGMAALHLAVLVAGAAEGDEVVVAGSDVELAFAAVRHAGAHPVYAADAAAVAGVVTPRTRAVVVSHLVGFPVEVAPARAVCDERALLLIEACGPGFGADVGGAGDLACFDLEPACAIGVGEGGLVLCRRERDAARLRLLRSHGLTSGTWDRHRGHSAGYDVVEIGFNYRLDEPRAALAASRLERLDEELAARRAAARAVREAVAGLDSVEVPWSAETEERAAPGALPLVVEGRVVALPLPAEGLDPLDLVHKALQAALRAPEPTMRDG